MFPYFAFYRICRPDKRLRETLKQTCNRPPLNAHGFACLPPQSSAPLLKALRIEFSPPPPSPLARHFLFLLALEDLPAHCPRKNPLRTQLMWGGGKGSRPLLNHAVRYLTHPIALPISARHFGRRLIKGSKGTREYFSPLAVAAA